MGSTQHRQIRRRSGKSDDRRPVGGRHVRVRAGGKPARQGTFPTRLRDEFSLFDNRFHLAPLAEAEKTGLEVQKAMGANSLADMRLASADKILAVQKDCQLGCSGTVTVWPDIDGYFLPAGVPDIFAAGKQNDVATVSGFTRDESSNALRIAGDLEAYVAAAHKLYGDQAERFLKLYPAATDAEAKAMGVTAAREGQAEAGTRNWALAQSATGKAPFYMYMFSRVHPFAEGVKFFDDPKSIGAYHTSDVPYWFGTQDAFNKFRVTIEDAVRSRSFGPDYDCLVAFALTVDPSTAATPWPRWTPKAENYLEFGDHTGVREENVERMESHTPANATPSTLRVCGTDRTRRVPTSLDQPVGAAFERRPVSPSCRRPPLRTGGFAAKVAQRRLNISPFNMLLLRGPSLRLR